MLFIRLSLPHVKPFTDFEETGSAAVNLGLDGVRAGDLCLDGIRAGDLC